MKTSVHTGLTLREAQQSALAHGHRRAPVARNYMNGRWELVYAGGDTHPYLVLAGLRLRRAKVAIGERFRRLATRLQDRVAKEVRQ